MSAGSYFDENVPDVVLKSLYSKYDTDASDQLSGTELCRLFIDDLGLDESAAQAYVLVLDKNGSNSVSFDEFSAWLKSGEQFKLVNDTSRFALLKKAVEMFRKYDENESQSLTREEFAKLHLDVGGNPEHTDTSLAALDKDGNGTISFPEFLKWLNWIQMEDF